MKTKELKSLFYDLDFKLLLNNLDNYKNKEKILEIYYNDSKNLYTRVDSLMNASLDPVVFRNSCLKYINKLIENLNYQELQNIASLFN